KNLFFNYIIKTMDDLVSATFNYVKKQLALSDLSLDDYFKYFDQQNQFLPPDFHSCLPSTSTSVNSILSKDEANSALGQWLITDINPLLVKEIQQLITAEVKRKVNLFLTNSSMLNEFTADTIGNIANYFNEQDKLIAAIDYDRYIQLYGSDD